MVTETVGSKGAKGVFLNMQTDSRTAVINEGDLLELDSSGNVVKCSAELSVKFLGVAASTVLATSGASQKQISVQVEGKCRVRGIYDSAGTYQTALVPGERVQIAEDSPSSYDGQVVAHAEDQSGSDPNSDAMSIGIALTAIGSTSTSPQNVDILLQPRSS